MKLLKLLLVLIFPLQLMASHIVGGEMYYDCLGDNNYRITIKVYRDCNSTGANFDTQLLLGVFKKSDNSGVKIESVNYPGSVVLPVVFSNPCVSAPGNICVQEAVYSKVINLPPLPEGYMLAYERCCRGPDIMNLVAPGDQGLTITTEIPGTNSGVSCNSSPRFTNYPPLLLCNNEPLIFDHSATDPDGDVLVYELSTPFHGGSNADPQPNPTNNPPYNLINWDNGFTANQPFSPSGPITINPNTGELIASPDLIGKFVVGVRVKEYRNGVLIGSTLRDFLFTVFNCVIDLNAEIVQQENMSTFNSYCDGLTIEFENDSYGASNYKWDFGVSSDTNSTSTSAEPTYTFPGEGEYTVSLILNPGWACADTSVEVFEIYQSLNVYFDPSDPQCITNNSFEFEGTGDYKNGSTFMWDFGNSATPNSAITESVNNIVYDSVGTFPVTYTVNWNDCQNAYKDSIAVHKEPSINFGIAPGLYCAPQLVRFIDSSSADAPISYLWNFGNGNTSTLQNPSNIYLNPGVYSVSLEISTLIGCVSTLNLNKQDLIEVFPSPIADFTVFPEETTVFESEIMITDQSINSEEHYYQLTPDTDTTERNLSFHFIEGGYHYPYQVVTNVYGCVDTAFREIYIEPYTTVYVPNSFTPDGNNTNDIFKPVIYDVNNYEFVIYNRWGEMFFKTTNTKEGWNGRYKGRQSPDGVYLWKIRYTNHLEINEIYHGSFTLFR
jgi:gliding motility-associated-like protein